LRQSIAQNIKKAPKGATKAKEKGAQSALINSCISPKIAMKSRTIALNIFSVIYPSQC